MGAGATRETTNEGGRDVNKQATKAAPKARWIFAASVTIPD